MRICIFLLVIAQVRHVIGSTQDVIGYWENWLDVVWWDNYMPGNCLMGCVTPQSFLKKTAPYSYVNYGFSFLTETPNPDQDGCTGKADCPMWDGKAIYLARASMQGSILVSDSIPTDNPASCSATSYLGTSSGLVAISETCRLARQGAISQGLAPKRCLLSLGGWSDYAAIGSAANAKKIAQLAAKAVQFAFLDGIDLDFEHLAPFESLYPGEFDNYIILVNTLREEFDKITELSWHQRASQHKAWFDCTYKALEGWQQTSAYYYTTNSKYMDDILGNPKPSLEISFTTRFNAFIPDDDKFNYLLPGSPVPKENFATDNEGLRLWDSIKGSISNINVMCYDGGFADGALQLNFTQVLKNFVDVGSVPKETITLGMEPGEQNGGGVWEGYETDIANVAMVKAEGYGGVMYWAINQDPALMPDSVTYTPMLADASFTSLAPTYPDEVIPTFSKINLVTGWLA